MINQHKSHRSLVHGVGVNDADYAIFPKFNGSKMCPYYDRWKSMLSRCYGNAKHNHRYRDCSVDKEWLTFSNFRTWMIDQDWQDKHLDKDILFQGNKVYSASTCIFVDSHLNHLLAASNKTRGTYPIGVSWDKSRSRYLARCCNGDGIAKNLGRFETEDQAHEAYKKYKYALIKDQALQQTEPLRTALLRYEILKF